MRCAEVGVERSMPARHMCSQAGARLSRGLRMRCAKVGVERQHCCAVCSAASGAAARGLCGAWVCMQAGSNAHVGIAALRGMFSS